MYRDTSKVAETSISNTCAQYSLLDSAIDYLTVYNRSCRSRDSLDQDIGPGGTPSSLHEVLRDLQNLVLRSTAGGGAR